MNSRFIKILAIITMTVDHIGFMLYPQLEIFRIIGRFSMPMFCFLIAYGACKTRNTLKYFLRLFSFAAVIQIVFNLVVEGDLFSFHQWNVFFTLSFGVLAIWLIKVCVRPREFWIAFNQKQYILINIILISLAAAGICLILLIAKMLPIDYGMAGVACIIIFYFGFKFKEKALQGCLFLLALVAFNVILKYTGSMPCQWYSFFAIIPLLIFVDKKLKISRFEKYAFYLYYPLHFVIIYVIGLLF